MGFNAYPAEYQVAITLDGQWLLRKYNAEIIIIDPLTDNQEQLLRPRLGRKRWRIRNVTLVAKSLDSCWLILGFADKSYSEWYLPQTLSTRDKKAPPFVFRAVSANGCWAIRETKDHSIQIQNLITGKISHQFSEKRCILDPYKRDELWKGIVSNTGNSIFLNSIEVWELDKGTITKRLRAYSSILSNKNLFIVSSDNTVCLIGSKSGDITLFDLHNDQKIYEMSGHLMAIQCAAISPDNKQIVTGSADGTFTVWHLQSETSINFKLDNRLSACAIHPDQTTILIGDIVSNVHIFEQVFPANASVKISEESLKEPHHPEEQHAPLHAQTINLWGMPRELLFNGIEGFAHGPCHLEALLYNQEHLIYYFEKAIPQDENYPLPNFLLPETTWAEDLQGYISLNTIEGIRVYIVPFTISCLIKNQTIFDKYRSQELNSYKTEDQYSGLSIQEKEAIFIEFLEFQRRILGKNHRLLEGTLDRIINFYQKQNDIESYKRQLIDVDVKITKLELWRRDIREAYKRKTIILNDKHKFTDSSLDSPEYIELIISFLEHKKQPFLKLDVFSSQTFDELLINDPKNADILPELFPSPMEHILDDIGELIKSLRQPDINRQEALKKIGQNLQKIFAVLRINEFLLEWRRTSTLRELRRMLKNPRNLQYEAMSKIFLGTFLITLISYLLSLWSGTHVNNWLWNNQNNLLISFLKSLGMLALNSLMTFWFGALVTRSIVNQPDVFSKLATGKTNIWKLNFLSEQKNKQFSDLASTLLLLCLIPSVLFAVLLSVRAALYGLTIGGNFSALVESLISPHQYWLAVFMAVVLVRVGGSLEFITSRFSSRSSMNFTSIVLLSVLAAWLGAVRYVSPFFWSLCLYTITSSFLSNQKAVVNIIRLLISIVLGIGISIFIQSHFGGNSFESVTIRAAFGALSSTLMIRSPSQLSIFGAGVGATASIYLAMTSTTQIFWWFFDKLAMGTAGFLVGGIIFSLYIIFLFYCFFFPCWFTLVGCFTYIRESSKVLQTRGFSPFLSYMFFLAIAVMGGGLGFIVGIGISFSL
ncbi:MAG: hypothetical protein AAGA80_04715 [Cyanobacteria bacterium P01_F01_bin.143]